jgi:hypothetical protein
MNRSDPLDPEQTRLDQRDVLDAAICDFLNHGGPVEGLDVALSRRGAVDLDMMVECLYEMNHRMSAAALHDLQAEAALSFEGPVAPIRLTA